MAKARIVWAVDEQSGAARHISEVSSGLACGCLCPGCSSRMEAVNSENPNWKKRPHFRHYGTSETEDCVERAMLSGVKEVLAGATEIELPELRVKRAITAQDGREFTAEEVEPSRRVPITAVGFVDAVDAVLTLADGQQIYVRLVATARSRSRDPAQTRLAEIVIDVSDPVLRTADPATLREHITLAPNARRWCSHWKEADLGADAEARARQLADQYWREFAETKPATATVDIPSATPSPQSTAPSKWTGPVVLVWAEEAPAEDKVQKAMRIFRLAWRNYDWENILRAGKEARLRGHEIAAALEWACETCRPAPSMDTIRRFWVGAGILHAIPKA